MIPHLATRDAAEPRERSEAELVAAARQRDESAIRELIRRLNPRLYRIARSLLASEAEAEDAVQDAYIAAFTHLDRFRHEAAFATWITRIALNTALMRRRSARPHEDYDTVTETDAASDSVVAFPAASRQSPETSAGQRELRFLLERAVDQLPPHLRVVFVLREVEDMSIAAIAQGLAINPVTVKTRLFRARRQLRGILEARIRGGFDAIFPFGGARCAAMADRVVATLARDR